MTSRGYYFWGFGNFSRLSSTCIGLVFGCILALLTTPVFAQDGAAIYAGNCAGCHGADGTGVIGPDLTVTTQTLDEIINTVTNGQGTMPGFSPGLTPDEIEAVGCFTDSLDGALQDPVRCAEGPLCGDGMIEPPEECDDGNTTPGDGCRADCTFEVCGDGIQDPQEGCDDGNNDDGDGCSANCTLEEEPVCGDGVMDPGEQCDDGNNDDGDGCSANCTLEMEPVCGDGVMDPGEQCDDGNNDDGDGCSANCTLEKEPVCGDRVMDPGEQCDDGNNDDGDGCSANCTLEMEPVCGDGVMGPGEQCDDGNTTSGDGCSANCTIEQQPPQPLTSLELLGKALFFDTNLSTPRGQACAVCHGPKAGWTGPDSDINAHGVVYEGAKRKRFGNRKPPSSAYATPSPIFHMTDDGQFMGGNFWDGRATGEKLGNPAADQALGPFLNPLEQANRREKTVCVRVKQSNFAKKLTGQSYEELFEQAFGPCSLDCRRKNALETYDRIGLAIGAYEASSEVNQYSSKYDAYLAGMVELTDQEQLGMELFTGQALCSACHLITPGPNGEPPLFTDFRYHNLGVPRNTENPFYTQRRKFNPDGANWIDPGLGGFLATRPEYQQFAADNMGKHKTPTLRNVDKRPYPGFVKAFMHNGVFKSLEEVVHFYNSRDITPGLWPEAEVGENLSPLLGNLGLTPAEEAALVVFMKTLNDGFMAP